MKEISLPEGTTWTHRDSLGNIKYESVFIKGNWVAVQKKTKMRRSALLKVLKLEFSHFDNTEEYAEIVLTFLEDLGVIREYEPEKE